MGTLATDNGTTGKRRRARVVPQEQFLVVRNLRYAMVTLTNLDTKEGVTIMPLEEVALGMEWASMPDIRKFTQNGHIETRIAAERPMPKPLIPPELTSRLSALDRSAAENIAFGDNEEIVSYLINVMPRLSSPNAMQNNKDIDAEYLKQRHVYILRAAEWWLENWQPGYIDWQGRLAHVRERIEFIVNYTP